MTKQIIIILTLTLTLTVSLAAVEKWSYTIDKIITKSGKIYYDVEIDKADSHGLAILHRSGCVSIPLDDLPDDLKKQYANKIEAKAEAKEKMLADIAARKKRRLQMVLLRSKSFYLVGEVFQTVLDGYLMYDVKRRRMEQILDRDGGRAGSDKSQMRDFFKISAPNEKIEYKKILAIAMKDHKLGSTYDREQVAFIRFVEEMKKKYRRNYQPLYVVGIDKKMIDGENWTGPVWRIGIYQYKTTRGSKKTVAKYTADPEVAAKYYKIKD
tara:strand:- start:158 stop:961 length:804 start_codon:yes stop_codon:yes gene_type:complete